MGPQTSPGNGPAKKHAVGRDFSAQTRRNQEWVDLELVLRELTELGARPLLLSMPIHGGWYERLGVTVTGRRAYYQKLRGMCARYHTGVVDFADHDADQSFCHDSMGHLAPSGLVYYNQVLDGFFHDAIPRQSELPARAPWRAERPKVASRPAWLPGLNHPPRVSTTHPPRQPFERRRPGRSLNQSFKEEKKSHGSY